MSFNSKEYYQRNKERIKKRVTEYSKSPRGQEVHRKAVKKYNKSSKRKEADKRFHSSPKRKEWARKYQRERYKLPRVHDYRTNYNKKYRRSSKGNKVNYDGYLNRNYGIRLIEYNKLLKKQEGKCVICFEPPKHTRLCVDHNHNTGEIRGLLCHLCNSVLGGCNDSIILLQDAIRYLRKFNKISRKTGKLYIKGIRRHGLSIEEYNYLFEIQNNCCAICFKTQTHKKLAIDHNHKTNMIRGLLCEKCNYMLGHSEDSISILQEAIHYLERNAV